MVIAVVLYQMYTAQYSTWSTALIQSFAALLGYAIQAVRTYEHTHSIRSEDIYALSLFKEEQEDEDEDEEGCSECANGVHINVGLCVFVCTYL